MIVYVRTSSHVRLIQGNEDCTVYVLDEGSPRAFQARTVGAHRKGKLILFPGGPVAALQPVEHGKALKRPQTLHPAVMVAGYMSVKTQAEDPASPSCYVVCVCVGVHRCVCGCVCAYVRT